MANTPLQILNNLVGRLAGRVVRSASVIPLEKESPFPAVLWLEFDGDDAVLHGIGIEFTVEVDGAALRQGGDGKGGSFAQINQRVRELMALGETLSAGIADVRAGRVRRLEESEFGCTVPVDWPPIAD